MTVLRWSFFVGFCWGAADQRAAFRGLLSSEAPKAYEGLGYAVP